VFQLRPFNLEDSSIVAAWVSSPEDAYALDPESLYPMSSEVVDQWRVESGSDYAFILCLDGEMVAYGDIIEDDAEKDIEIQRILVKPQLRDQGIGCALLNRLCAFIAENYPYSEVWMRVGPENDCAASCFRAAGFLVDETHTGPKYIWMKRSLVPAELETKDGELK
jgi:ribosomal protein S18 acetylase RimI-like enzyme